MKSVKRKTGRYEFVSINLALPKGRKDCIWQRILTNGVTFFVEQDLTRLCQ